MTHGDQPVRPGRDASAVEVWSHACTILGMGDCDGWADMLSEDVVLEWPFAPHGLPRRMDGRAEVRRLLTPVQEAAMSLVVGRDAQTATVHETADPEVIIAELDGVLELATGESFRMPLVHVVRVRDGEIVHFKDYFNPAIAAPAYAAVLEPLQDAASEPA